MADFVNTYPTPHRMDEASVARYREHDGEVSDEVDAARDREAEDGRYSTPGEDALFFVGLIALIACVIALVSLWAGYGDALVAWARNWIPAALSR